MLVGSVYLFIVLLMQVMYIKFKHADQPSPYLMQQNNLLLLPVLDVRYN